jgi:hypothetical protein
MPTIATIPKTKPAKKTMARVVLAENSRSLPVFRGAYCFDSRSNSAGIASFARWSRN